MSKADNVCPNCGASMHNKEYALICDHCGTVIFDYATLSTDGTPFFARIKMPDGSIAVMNLRCCGWHIIHDTECSTYAYDAVCKNYVSNNSCRLEMDFLATPFESVFKKDTLVIKDESKREPFDSLSSHLRTTVEDYKRNPIWPDGRD